MIPEHLITKLRALYQRNKGRDLFDLDHALPSSEVDPARVVEAFSRYVEQEGTRVTRAQFERNLAEKLGGSLFSGDVDPLLTVDVTWDAASAHTRVLADLIARLPGDPWAKSSP